MAYGAQHLGVALEAAGAVDGEEEYHVRRSAERLVQLLLVLPRRSSPNLVFNRQNEVFVAAALDYKVPGRLFLLMIEDSFEQSLIN